MARTTAAVAPWPRPITIRTDLGQVRGTYLSLAEARDSLRSLPVGAAALAGLTRPPFKPALGEAVLESWATGPTEILWFMANPAVVAEAALRAHELAVADGLIAGAAVELARARDNAERGDPGEVQRQCQAALWRLVDAAGLVARDALPDAAGLTSASATGRGFYLGAQLDQAVSRDRRASMRRGGVR